MMSFLGMCSYCRQFISDYAILEAALASFIHGKDLQPQNKITWTSAAEQSSSRDVMGYSDLTLLVPHAVSMILLEQKTSHLSTARWLRYNTVLLEMPNITVKRCNVLNPATLFPTSVADKNITVVLQQVCSPRPDLQETPCLTLISLSL